MSIKLTALLFLMIIIVSCSQNETDTVEPTINYSTITATTASTPEFLENVWPEPGATLSLDNYQISLKSESPHWRGIEVAVWAHRVDQSDNNSPRSVLKRSYLFVDGQLINNENVILADGLMIGDLYDKNGQFISTISMGPYYMSWSPKLTIGIHNIKFQVERQSGEILEFVWSITITE